MESLPDIAPLAIVLIIASAALAVLHTLSTAIRNDLLLLELSAKTARLRTQYRKRLSDGEAGEIIVVDEAPPEPVPEPARAAA